MEKISDIILQLESLRATHGDLPVYGRYDGHDSPGVGIQFEARAEWLDAQQRPVNVPDRIIIET